MASFLSFYLVSHFGYSKYPDWVDGPNTELHASKFYRTIYFHFDCCWPLADKTTNTSVNDNTNHLICISINCCSRLKSTLHFTYHQFPFVVAAVMVVAVVVAVMLLCVTKNAILPYYTRVHCNPIEEEEIKRVSPSLALRIFFSLDFSQDKGRPSNHSQIRKSFKTVCTYVSSDTFRLISLFCERFGFCWLLHWLLLLLKMCSMFYVWVCVCNLIASDKWTASVSFLLTHTHMACCAYTSTERPKKGTAAHNRSHIISVLCNNRLYCNIR